MQAFLAAGAYQRHVRRTSQEYQRRRIAILEALSEAFPGVPVAGVQAGLHLVLLLSDVATQTGTVNALRAQGIATQPLSASYQSTPRFGALIGTARTTPQQIRMARETNPVTIALIETHPSETSGPRRVRLDRTCNARFYWH